MDSPYRVGFRRPPAPRRNDQTLVGLVLLVCLLALALAAGRTQSPGDTGAPKVFRIFDE